MIERARNGAANGAVWKGNIRSPLVESPSGNNRIFVFSFSFLLISKTSNDTWFFLLRLMKIMEIVDRKTREPVAPGELGVMVVTELPRWSLSAHPLSNR